MDLTVAQAAEILDISSDGETLENLEKETVKQKFRQKVKEDHPDQGGSREQFDKDRKAKDKLLNFVGSEYQDKYSKLKTTRSKTRTRSRNENRSENTDNTNSNTNSNKTKTKTSNQTDSRNTSTSTNNQTNNTTTSQNTTDTKSNTTQEDWYDKAQRNTTKTTEPTEEEFTKDDSFFYSNLVAVLTYFNLALLKLNETLRTKYILFIGSSVMGVKLLGEYLESDSVLLTLPGIESITPEIAQLFLFVAPILIYIDMRAQKMEANYTLSQVLQTDIVNLDEENPIKYNIITKLLLLGGSFGYTGIYLTQLTQYSSLLIVIAQLSIVLLYSILRKTPPNKSQISKEYR